MYIDELTEFCDAEALGTGGTGLQLVGDVVDLGAGVDDIGDGTPLYLTIQVDTAVTSAGSATVEFILASDAAAAIATDGSATQHVSSTAIGKATLVAGYEYQVEVPVGSYERYLGILANVGTAAVTAGAINAFLTPNRSNRRIYADAVK